jgi:uncharacterized protein YjiS (DUF1127 family)
MTRIAFGAVNHTPADLVVSVAVYNVICRIEAAYNRARTTLNLWIQRSEERDRLASIVDEVSRDTGISSDIIRAEVNKPFWRA